MATKLSAGLLPYRVRDNTLQLFLVHPGGPLWAKKDDSAWSVAKGEYEDGEDPALVALREFEEETGVKPPSGEHIHLGEIKQPSGKRIQVWAVEAAIFDPGAIVSNEFEMEWPPRSGQTQSFPEVDRAEWMSAARARRKLVKGQTGFVDRLTQIVRTRYGSHLVEGTDEEPPVQGRALLICSGALIKCLLTLTSCVERGFLPHGTSRHDPRSGVHLDLDGAS